MAIRAIMMPVNGATDEPSEWAAGIAVAQALAAHLEAVYVRPDPQEAFSFFGLNPATRDAETHRLQTRLEEQGKADAARARRRFGALCRKAGLAKARHPRREQVATAGWRTLTGEAHEVIPAAARGADLSLFTDAPSRYNVVFENLLEATMLRSGRPALFLPNAGIRDATPFRRPLIGWDGTSGCTRAISTWIDMAGDGAAARILHVAEQDGDAPAMSEVVAHLGWHGISAETETRPRGLDSVGEVLLAAAKRSGADLIVMGGYGRARYREALFGGVTRYVIRNARIPVLMAH